mgnify:CR=1 FL=1
MEFETVNLKLRQATLDDLEFWENWKRKGQPFWEKSKISGKFDNKPCLLSGYINLKEFKLKITLGMIYIPASDLE